MIFNTDSSSDMAALALLARQYSSPEAVHYAGVIPRNKLYGDIPGVEAIGNIPDVLLQPDQYEDALRKAHADQSLPIYHMQDTWSPPDYKYNQDGTNYCWTWSGTGALMTCRACEDKETVKLAPVSMGYLVGWRNNGNYLEDFINGARQDGICPAINGNMNDVTRSASYWEPYKEQRKLYRLDKCWDTDKQDMKQHCLSILVYGRPIYAALTWWSHAVHLVGIRIEGGVWYWDYRNSHNDLILTLTGTKAEPDEAIGFISTVAA